MFVAAMKSIGIHTHRLNIVLSFISLYLKSETISNIENNTDVCILYNDTKDSLNP
jgi:hypothetical protein